MSTTTTKAVQDVICPTHGTPEQLAEGLVGCGSANVTRADREGLHDCGDCGLFFTAAEAERSH